MMTMMMDLDMDMDDGYGLWIMSWTIHYDSEPFMDMWLPSPCKDSLAGH